MLQRGVCVCVGAFTCYSLLALKWQILYILKLFNNQLMYTSMIFIIMALFYEKNQKSNVSTKNTLAILSVLILFLIQFLYIFSNTSIDKFLLVFFYYSLSLVLTNSDKMYSMSIEP